MVSYSVLLHPLRNIPGPFLAKITDLYNGYFAYKKSNHLVAYENFQKYGAFLPQVSRSVQYTDIEY